MLFMWNLHLLQPVEMGPEETRLAVDSVMVVGLVAAGKFYEDTGSMMPAGTHSAV